MSFVQAKQAAGSAMSDGATLAFDSNVVAGNAIIILGWHSYIGCPPSITDSQGNTYTSKGTQPSLGGNTRFWVFTAKAASSGALTLTSHMACGNFVQYVQVEVSGLQDDPYDVQNVNASNSSSPWTAGSITPSADGAYIGALFSTDGSGSTYTARSGFTIRTTSTNSAFEDLVQGTAGAINPDIDSTIAAGVGMTAAFKAAAPPSPDPSFRVQSFRPRMFAPGLAR